MIGFDDQQVTVRVKFALPFHCISFVYAKVLDNARHPLWSILKNYASSLNESWLILGDFNVILGAHVKTG